MAEEGNVAEGQAQETQAGAGQEDWQAKYESMRAHSREWEKKARANQEAADELEKLRESQASEQEGAAKRAEKAEAELAAYKAQAARAEAVAEVAGKAGIPAEAVAMLSGKDADELGDQVARLPKLFGRQFDQTIMGSVTKPGENFDTLGAAQAVSLTPSGTNTVYDQFLAADELISDADGIMNGIALSPKGRSVVLAAKDGNGYPLFTSGVGAAAIDNILGAPVQVKKGVYVADSDDAAATLGIAGDWDNAYYGVVNSITGSVSNEATIEYASGDSTVTLNLWQRNMFAVRFEVELAFMVRDADVFVRLTA